MQQKREITIPESKVPVVDEVEVLVAGGGPAGFAAGVAAARNGARTLIVEQFNCLGGLGTAGLVGPFMKTVGADGGIFKEILDRMTQMGGADGYRFEVESFKYAAQEIAMEAGAKLLFHTFVEKTIVEKNKLRGVLVANKGGRQAILSRTTIDATGDGDVAYFSGCEYEKGDSKGTLQGSSMMFRLGGIDSSRVPTAEVVKDLLLKARKKGEIKLPEYVNWILGSKGSTIMKGQVSVNIDTTTDIDGTSPQDLTTATIESRRRIKECLDFYHKYVPGYEKCYLIDTSTLYGIRETRRILGEYYLTYEDVKEGRRFEDGIARASFGIDIHCAEMFNDPTTWHLKKYPVPKEEGYEIPYRSLVPRNIDNLLLSGRCISSDRETNGSLRIMPTCMATGQAAGTAAALAVKEKKKPRELNGKTLRETLISQGADLK